MRLSLCLLVAALAVLFVAKPPGLPVIAAPATSTPAPATELLVFEHPQCTYCEVFRRNVLPKYQIATHVSAPPVRFIDVSNGDLDRLGLSARIQMVPTAVVLRDGREMGRIEGYWSSANFFAMLAHILDAAG